MCVCGVGGGGCAEDGAHLFIFLHIPINFIYTGTCENGKTQFNLRSIRI